MNLSKYDKQEAMAILRDELSTMVYQIMDKHVSKIKRAELSDDPRLEWMKVRKEVYECQTWYHDVWDEEVTYYPGHGVTTPAQSREYLEKVHINTSNAHIFADALWRRSEDKRYELIPYLREHIKIAR